MVTMNLIDKIKNRKSLVVNPLRHIALFTIVAGTYALIFEVNYFSDFSINIYFGRLLATLLGFIILLLTYTKFGRKHAIGLIHVLLISIILSFASIIYMLPKTLFVNSHLLALTIFTIALFLSWDTKNQIIVAIYYNLIFSASILFNDSAIYFLPNFLSTVIFVLMISILSIGATSINSRLRENLITKSLEIKEIFNNSIEGIFRIKHNGDIVSANKSFWSLFKMTNKNNSLNIKDIFIDEDGFNEIQSHLEKHGSIRDFILKHYHKTRTSYLSFNMKKSNLDENVYDGSILDVTDREISKKRQREAFLKLKKAKALLQKQNNEILIQSENKIQFLAKINHDLKTPINSISLILDMIATNIISDEDELKEYTTAAKISTESILSTLDKYLDYTKIEAGKLELENEVFTIHDLIEECNILLQPIAISKKISLIFKTEENIPNLVEGDVTHYKRIIMNLVNNGIKFTNAGYVKVHLKKGYEDDDTVEIITEVADTGIGIPKEKIEQLFAPYSQVDSKRDSANGSGLGLIISKEFANLLGGNIHVESKVGVGTTFIFNVIFKKVDITEKKKGRMIIENNHKN